MIRVHFTQRKGEFAFDVDATLSSSAVTGVFGPSGAGKTTLLRMIAGLDTPHAGVLSIGEDTLFDSHRNVDVPVHDRRIGYVFQEPRLFPHLDVRGNLEYAARRARTGATLALDDVSGMLGLGPLLARKTGDLSGGEAQRVAIGRALLSAPRLLLLDEPVAALDAASRDDVLPFVRRLRESFDVPVLYVSHNVEEICWLCDELLIVDAGRSQAHGELQSVLTRTDVPVLGGDEAGSVIEARVVDYDAHFDLSELLSSAGTLRVPGRFDRDRPLRLRLRANDISLCLEPPRSTSILNTLHAKIHELVEDGPASVLVHLYAGDEELVARITRRSADELGVAPGTEVILQIKSVSVRHA